MASTLKAKGYGDDDILGEFDDNYSFPRQLIPETMKGKPKKKKKKSTPFINNMFIVNV